MGKAKNLNLYKSVAYIYLKLPRRLKSFFYSVIKEDEDPRTPMSTVDKFIKVYINTLFNSCNEYLSEAINKLLAENTIKVKYNILKTEEIELTVSIKNKKGFKLYLEKEYSYIDKKDNKFAEEILNKIAEDIAEAIIKQEEIFLEEYLKNF